MEPLCHNSHLPMGSNTALGWKQAVNAHYIRDLLHASSWTGSLGVFHCLSLSAHLNIVQRTFVVLWQHLATVELWRQIKLTTSTSKQMAKQRRSHARYDTNGVTQMAWANWPLPRLSQLTISETFSFVLNCLLNCLLPIELPIAYCLLSGQVK